MRKKLQVWSALILLVLCAPAVEAANGSPKKKGKTSPKKEEGSGKSKAIEKKEKEKAAIAAELALNEIRLQQELASIKAEIAQIQAKQQLENLRREALMQKELSQLKQEAERLRIAKELSDLKHAEAMRSQVQKHEAEILAHRQKMEKARVDTELTQTQIEKAKNDLLLLTHQYEKKIRVLTSEADQKQAELRKLLVKKERSKFIDANPKYLKNPYRKEDKTLILSERCIPLDGPIVPWKAEFIVDRIQYYNNQNTEHPIFITIGICGGGSAWSGQRILKAMESSKAPVYVVVRSFAASMASIITTFAEKSFIHPDAEILHHQPWTWMVGNPREIKEELEKMNELWRRWGTKIAKKMGISFSQLNKKLYENSARGDWKEYGDKAVKIKWVDHVINGTIHTGVLEEPQQADYTWESFMKRYWAQGKDVKLSKKDGKPVVYLPRLDPNDYYYIYNPNGYYQVQ